MALDSVTLAANAHSATRETRGTMNRSPSMSRIDRVRPGWRGEFAGCRGESMAPLAMDLKGSARSLGECHRALWAQTNREPGRIGLVRRHRSIPPDDGITLLVVLEQFRGHVVAPAVTNAEFLVDRYLHCALPLAGSPPPPAGKTSGRLSMPTRPAGQVARGAVPGASSYSGIRRCHFSSATRISILARCEPRQPCGPPPNARCRSWRWRSIVSGSGCSAGSRLATATATWT